MSAAYVTTAFHVLKLIARHLDRFLLLSQIALAASSVFRKRLKPCPECGSLDVELREVENLWAVLCKTCGETGLPISDDKASAIAVWNDRDEED